MKSLPLLLLPLVGACRAGAWERPVVTHGSMRAVMREGATQGRVRLADAVGRDGYGLGALAGLAGEIAIVGGEVWLGRPAAGGVECTRGAASDEEATLLAVAEVRSWREETLERDLAPEELAAAVAELGARAGLGSERPWPFVIEGELLALEGHVLNGACPFAGECPPGQEPVRRAFEHARGLLVGFHAPGEAGRLVHHGETLHTHVVLAAPEAFVAHVDRTGLRAGARIRIPRE